MLKRIWMMAVFLTPLAWGQPAEDLEERLHFDLVKVEVGKELLPLVEGKPAPLLEEMRELRGQLEKERGFMLPGVRFRDSLSLKPKEYVISVREQEVARGELEPRMYLAAAKQPGLLKKLPGVAVDLDHVFFSKWIAPGLRDKAEKLGCFVLGPEELVGWKVRTSVLRHAAELFGRQEMLMALPEVLSATFSTDPAAQDRCLRVCRSLLAEGLPIRVKSVAELVLDKSLPRQDTDSLLEQARAELKVWISEEYAAPKSKSITVVALSPAWESRLRAALQQGPEGLVIAEAGALERALIEPLSKLKSGQVIYTPDDLRLALRRLSGRFPGLHVMAHSEVAPGYSVKKLQEL